MLTVHQMPPKNQFLTGISSVYDKTPNQNEPQPFASLSFSSDCFGVDYGEESCHRINSTFTGTEIFNYSSTKPVVGLLLTFTFLITSYCNFALFLDKSN
jgi:hypothetical protein